ncbi:MAG: AzlD domain-containing protein [Lachnospiraceae bacterium]|nr:AzlD domain-containing protein [Lachnospiraceae bacterium]
MMHNVYIYILAAALVTYLIRALPLVLWRKEITSPFVKSFLYYVPYACLAAMTFPAMITATESIISGLVGFLVAAFLAFRKKSLVVVALWACVAVFIVERALTMM